MSRSEKSELKDVVDCLRQATTLSWIDVQKSGGRGGSKAGLGYTPYKDSDLRGVTRPQGIAEDVTIFGLRASEKYRVFAAYQEHVVYLLWFDRGHSIVPV